MNNEQIFNANEEAFMKALVKQMRNEIDQKMQETMDDEYKDLNTNDNQIAETLQGMMNDEISKQFITQLSFDDKLTSLIENDIKKNLATNEDLLSITPRLENGKISFTYSISHRITGTVDEEGFITIDNEYI